MALLPTGVTAGQTGHIGHSNQVHRKLNGLCLDAVADFGATGDGSTDDTAAIQAALDAAAPSSPWSPAGTVHLPSGEYIVTGLALAQRVTLQGVGLGTRLKLKTNAGTLANLITNKQDYEGVNDAQAVTVRNLRLEGNKGNQLANSWNCGIVFNNDTPSGNYEWTDGRHQVSNVIIDQFTGDGFVQADRGVVQVSNVQVFDVDGFGFNINIDSEYVNCDAGGCGLDGWLIQGNNLLSNCKSWYSGYKLTSNRFSGAGATATTRTPPTNAWDGGNIAGLVFSLANGYGNGFTYRNISGSSVAGNYNGGTTTGCNAQDNARAGFFVDGGRQTLVGCEADSNNNAGTTDGTSSGTPLGTYAGFELASNASNNTVIGLSWDRAANLARQASVLALPSSTGHTGNRIELTFYGTLFSGANTPPLRSSSLVDSNRVQLRSAGGGFVAATFASSYTPDPFGSEVYAMTLTGPVTFANPALTGTNTGTGIYLVPGMRLTLLLTQDGTGGRTVTLGANYKLNGKAFSTTASATTGLTFLYDGTNWQAI